MDLFIAKRILRAFEIDDSLLLKKAKKDVANFDFYLNNIKSDLFNIDLNYPEKYKSMVKLLTNKYITKEFI